MSRKPVTDISAWPSLTLEGNLIAPALVVSIDRKQASEQTEEDYRIRKGLTIREEISTAFRVGQSHFDAFAKLERASVEATRRFVRAFLAETFGFDDLAPTNGVTSFLAGGRVPIVVVPPSEERLDRRSPTLSTDRSRSPAFALQDYLNDSDDALWGLVTNGVVIRLMRDNASLTRPAYIEADLAQIFTNEDAASFAVLWSLIHRTRFGIAGTPATDCALERWRGAGSREGEAARDRLAVQVEIALRVLGSGFLEANPDLAARLKSGEVNLTEWFNELLRLVYRLIFLMVAEDRNLLHSETAKPAARKLYAEGYSLAALRAQCVRAVSWDRHHDRYEGIKVVFSALAHGQEALGLPALGGLFGADKLPHIETARLRNRAFMEALYRLSWLADKTGMVPVNWRAMETEELGSVYESLLQLQPQLGDDSRTLHFASETAEQKGNQRKTTGSYYTPDSLVQALLDTALDPVLDKTEAEGTDPAQALLKLSVIDPACGSGHFLLAAARRIATRLARIRTEGTPALGDFRHALRDVARCCIYGVDRNPMAVELTKVALWIETVDPGLPLGFFDAQIRCGDSLFGVFDLSAMEQGVPDAAYKPQTGDDKDVARHYAQKNKREITEKDSIAKGFGFDRARDLIRDFEALRAMPENTVAQIEAKTTRLHALTGQGASVWQLERACDLYVSAFLLPKTKGGPHAGPDGMPRRGAEGLPTSGTIWEWLRGVQPFTPMFDAAMDAARKAHAFHWPLEFPDVMQRGGFDVVLGNPPWEVMQLSDKEYFATINPEIAALAGAARKKAIESLAQKDPASFTDYQRALAASEAINEFSRESGRFDLTARGKVNTYALFSELFAKLSGQKGRAGLIVPTGIATDSSTAQFFAWLMKEKRLSSLIDFENRERLFPEVYYRVKFCLMTLGNNEATARFSFFLTNPAQLADPERSFTLTPDEIARLNPNSRTAPVFRSRADAKLAAKIYSKCPILIEDAKGIAGNPWSIEFRQGLFNLTSESGLFRTAQELSESELVREGMVWVQVAPRVDTGRQTHKSAHGESVPRSGNIAGTIRYLPLYEAKMIHQFDHRWGGYDEAGEPSSDASTTQKVDPSFEIAPRYWVPETEVDERLAEKGWKRNWLMGWRDIANTVNERTTIASVVPKVGVAHSMPLMFTDIAPTKWIALLGNLNSMVLDYCARQSVGGTHLTYGYMKQFPVLPPEAYTESRLAFIVPKVLELSYTSKSLAPFAQDLGRDGPPFRWSEDRRAMLRADLDAFYARAYGLSRDELRYILDPADVKGAEYPSETFRVLKEREIREFGEYRTRRFVLEAWDRMEADGTFVNLGLGAGQRADIAPTIQKPAPATLPDGAWIRASQQPNDAGAALTAILKALNGPTPSRTVRLAAAMMLEPHLLTSLLPEVQARDWRRLVGQEAEPRTGNVVGFASRTNQGWGTAVSNHRGNGRLIENLSAWTWAPGPGLDAFDTAGWPDGRARFVLEALGSLDLDTTVTSMPDEVRSWITHAAAA
jgi:hypothetical protein